VTFIQHPLFVKEFFETSISGYRQAPGTGFSSRLTAEDLLVMRNEKSGVCPLFYYSKTPYGKRNTIKSISRPICKRNETDGAINPGKHLPVAARCGRRPIPRPSDVRARRRSSGVLDHSFS